VKNVQLTTIFTCQVPDDTDIDALCLNLDLGQVQMVYCHDPELLESKPFGPMKAPVKGKLLGYETVNVEVFDEDGQ
jgi:hypothetical protein